MNVGVFDTLVGSLLEFWSNLLESRILFFLGLLLCNVKFKPYAHYV